MSTHLTEGDHTGPTEDGENDASFSIWVFKVKFCRLREGETRRVERSVPYS